jgi:hypothetical protein
MIKIIRGAEVDGPKGQDGPRRHGMWAYHAPAYPEVCGYSRQPLLDACRQLKSLYGLSAERAGVFGPVARLYPPPNRPKRTQAVTAQAYPRRRGSFLRPPPIRAIFALDHASERIEKCVRSPH